MTWREGLKILCGVDRVQLRKGPAQLGALSTRSGPDANPDLVVLLLSMAAVSPTFLRLRLSLLPEQSLPVAFNAQVAVPIACGQTATFLYWLCRPRRRCGINDDMVTLISGRRWVVAHVMRVWDMASKLSAVLRSVLFERLVLHKCSSALQVGSGRQTSKRCRAPSPSAHASPPNKRKAQGGCARVCGARLSVLCGSPSRPGRPRPALKVSAMQSQ